MYSILMYFLIFFIIIILFNMLINKVYTVKLDNQKYPQLDGLRGILAISIIYTHSIIMYNFFIYNTWQIPPSTFYTLIGEISVSLFFIITGFLFGFKLFSSEFNIKKFFISRIKRIVPLQIFSVFLSIIVIMSIDNFILHINFIELFFTSIKWLVYGFYGQPLINNNYYSGVIETVYWTLRAEWKFYLLLPLLFLMKNKLFKKDIYFLWFLIIIFSIYKNIPSALFVVGITISYIEKYKIKFSIKYIDFFAILALISIFFIFETAYHKIVLLLLFIVFFAIIYGSTFKKLLMINSLRFFGKISYSIYLLHNIIVFSIFYLTENYYKSISSIYVYEYWFIVFICIILTIILSSFTYKHIEHRFYQSMIK